MPFMYQNIPLARPATPLLDSIASPADVRALKTGQLPQLADELRHFLLFTVGQTGGHFGAGLGVVELTIALHYVFETPVDKLIWDVGHQTYPHKILTGRREQMHSLRQKNGIAPFPSRDESEYDVFGVGHSSTSISAAVGLALASSSATQKTLVVIGDGAMTAGIAFEALNHVAATAADVLIVLNDNAMSISENVGGLANYFARNLSGTRFSSKSSQVDTSNLHQTTHGLDQVTTGGIFRDLGFDYTGPIDGHDLDELVRTLAELKDRSGPRLLHVVTTKGKGYGPAESAPVTSHALTKLEKNVPPSRATGSNANRTFSEAFGTWACNKAATDRRLVAITPAMKEGSGLVQFAAEHPDRFYDVAIAEQHAVTFAAGLAIGGEKPVVAIYSTFLQRAYDQLIHDVALQKLDVLFVVDRASLLEDGPTHSGVFDLSFVRAIPNMTIMAPAAEIEFLEMLDLGFDLPGPVMVRFPRGRIPEACYLATGVEVGKAEIVRHTGRSQKRVVIFSFGTMLDTCLEVAEANDYSLINMRFVKPLDARILREFAANHDLIVTCEENAITGGAGSGINEALASMGIAANILNLGVPDEFINPDQPGAMLAICGLDVAGIEQSINLRL